MASPVHGALLLLCDCGQPRVAYPADAGVGVVIHDAVEGAVDAVGQPVIHQTITAHVLAHAVAIDVEKQAGAGLSKVPAGSWQTRSAGQVQGCLKPPARVCRCSVESWQGLKTAPTGEEDAQFRRTGWSDSTARQSKTWLQDFQEFSRLDSRCMRFSTLV